MCTSRQRLIEASVRLDPPSPLRALIGVIAGCALIAAAVWCGNALHDSTAASNLATAHPLEIVDAERALIFKADSATGDVRILNVRNGISEVARLHENERQHVTAITLDTEHSILTVVSENARDRYDTRTFRLLTHGPMLAAGADL